MMKRALFLFAVSMSFILSSCLGNEGGIGGSKSVTYEGVLIVKNADDVATNNNDKYQVILDLPNISQKRMNITFNNFSFVGVDTPVSLVFLDIPYKETFSADNPAELNYVIDVQSTTPYVNGLQSADYEVEPLQGTFSKSGVTIRFSMKQKPYSVQFTVTPKPQI